MTITIVATASGSLLPPTVEFPQTVTNGDFVITGNDFSPIVGDGINERTTWTFDFNRDANFPAFSTSLTLTSAILTLTLTPKSRELTNDPVAILELREINTPLIESLPINVTSTVHLQLLDFYSSSEILGALNNGQIQMFYGHDAIVSAAKLELTQRVPALQYAVKFVCGQSRGEVVAPGRYFTAINVHNPAYKDVRFRKKITVALPNEESGPVSKFFGAKLGPDRSLEIDCKDIFQHANANTDFLKGFVVIESDYELDVVAVYTAAGSDGEVETFHTERVLPRRQEKPVSPKPQGTKLPDLVPLPDPRPGFNFCKVVKSGSDEGKLIVTVKNQGDADAPASTTTVVFPYDGSVDLPTPSIPKGGSVDLIPIAMPRPYGSFKIIVDSKNQVIESNKANNIADGECLG